MKKILLIVMIAGIAVACNNPNDGSASTPFDSLRIKDSTHLADSLQIVDTINRMIDTTQRQ